MANHSISDSPENHFPSCPELLPGEDRYVYVERVTAWERAMEDAIHAHIKMALAYAAHRWNESYAPEYVSGALDLYHPAGRERTVYHKRPIPASLRTTVFERDRYRCRACGTHCDLSVDHIIPESRGGTLNIDNLQTLCRSCNSRKGAR